MRKLFLYLGCFLTLFFSIFFVLKSRNKNDSPSAQEQEKKPSFYSKNSPNTTFVISEYEGNVAVFEKYNSSPLKITNIQLTDLPQQDQELLKKGIEVNTKEELSNILEDYCS